MPSRGPKYRAGAWHPGGAGRVQGSHTGGSRMQDPGWGHGEKEGGTDAARGFLPTLCPAHQESWGEGSLATPPSNHLLQLAHRLPALLMLYSREFLPFTA